MTKPNEVEALAVRPKQAAKMLGVGKTRLFELIAAGEIKSYRDGRSRLIDTASIHARHQQKLQESRAA